MLERAEKNSRPKKAQATLEFTFAFIMLALIFFGAVKALQWLGVVLASPTDQYHEGLYTYPKGGGGATTNNPHFDPLAQLSGADAKILLPKLKLTFDGQLLTGTKP